MKSIPLALSLAFASTVAMAWPAQSVQKIAAALTADRPVVVNARGTIEVAFSPNGQATAATTRFIGEAQRSIRVAAYGLTSNEIGAALVAAHKRGVDVRVVVDKDHNGGKESGNSVARFLASNGIPVRIDTAVLLQHNKILIVDEISVQNGSFNFTVRAENKNAENITIHRNNAELAAVFTKNWNHLWNESNPFDSRY